MSSDNELHWLSAVELSHLIRTRAVSCVEVMEAHLRQIERVNPRVNAIVTKVPADQVLERAASADRVLASGADVGPLHGLPVAHKDLFETSGLRTTWGSALYADFVPKRDALIVERQKRAGAITIGKTNTPEFGAGSQTFNEVFGATANPYDVSRTCGGSSGGSAVALACGMVPLADGSDLGGSLRNPAAFCNIVGFRPSGGRVPAWPAELGWCSLGVHGPMGRSVADVALLLSAIAGPDARCPYSIDAAGETFRHGLDRDFSGVRIAWCRDFGGIPMDPRVTEVLERQRHIFEQVGCAVEDTEPDWRGADEAFRVLRAWMFASRFGNLTAQQKSQLKETIIRNMDDGLKLTGLEVAEAEKKRTRLFHRLRKFMETFEFLVLPVTQVVPFDIAQPYVSEINGITLETYIDWMKSCYFVSVTGLPAISVPGGFTADGLPVGLQIVGRHRDDFGVLQLAAAFESAVNFGKRRPEIAN